MAIAAGASVTLPDLASANIYWANFGSGVNGGVGTDTLDGNPLNRNQTFIPAADAESATGVADDGRFIYWTSLSGNAIGRADLDGSSPNPNFITGQNQPISITVSGGFVYWINNGGGTIKRDTIDGNPANIVTLVSGLTDPDGIAVDGSHIYWGNGNGVGSTIGRANLDGSGANSNFITGQNGPIGIALAGGFIYWSDWQGGTLERDTIDGNPADIKPLVAGLTKPIGIAVTNSHIYWSSQTGMTIGVANVDGSSPSLGFITTASEPFDIAIDLPPSVISPPTIRGSVLIGRTLTESNGGWNGNPTAFAHRWLRCTTSGANCSAIAGATEQTYVVSSADVGATIRAEEIASNPLGGSSNPAVSSPTGVVGPPPSPSPPPPSRPPPPPVPPTATIASRSAPGAADQRLTLACHGTAGQECSATVLGTVKERRRAGSILAVTASKQPNMHSGKPKTRIVTVTVVRATLAVPAGRSSTATLALNSAGKSLLARFHRLPVNLTFSGSITGTRTVMFTIPGLHVNTPPDNWFHINLPCANCYTMAVHVPITGLPARGHVSVSCEGGGCPYAHRPFAVHQHQFDLAPALQSSHLEPGTVVDVLISAPGHAGVIVQYAIQRGAAPLRSLCPSPGAGGAGRCP